MPVLNGKVDNIPEILLVTSSKPNRIRAAPPLRVFAAQLQLIVNKTNLAVCYIDNN